MRSSFARLALAAAALIAGAGGLHAEDARVKHISLSIKVPYKSDINVISSTGKSWDRILAARIPLWADIKIDTAHPGYVERAGLFLGACSGSSCGMFPRLMFWSPIARDWQFHGLFDFDTGTIPVSNGGIAITSFGDRILSTCNADNTGSDTSRPRSFDVTAELSLSVNTRKAQFMSGGAILEGGDDAFDGGDANARTSFSIRVNCLAFAHAEAAPKPAGVDIRVKEKVDSCPKDVEVTAYIDYQVPMTARFRVLHNGKPSEPIEIKARKVSLAGKTWYRIERLERYTLNPGKHNFQIKVIGGGESPKQAIDVDCAPFKVTSLWLTYKVADKDTCPKKVVETVTAKATRPGKAPFEIKTAGGLVVHSGTMNFVRRDDAYVAEAGRNNLSLNAFDSEMMASIKNQPGANSGWVRLKVDCLEAVSGKLTLQSLGAESCKGEALVAIHTNGAGTMPYELECGPGRSWKRKIEAFTNGIGVDKLRFDVTNKEQVTCTLRTRIGGQLKPLDGASKTFQCHKPSGVSGADGLVPETKPDPKRPSGPGLAVIDETPAISCANGKVKKGACVCTATQKPVKAGDNAWRCVKIVVSDPPKADASSGGAPKKEIACVGGKVKAGACVCGPKQKVVKTGKKAWRCVKIVAIDPGMTTGAAASTKRKK
jgi:hypothetical protein